MVVTFAISLVIVINRYTVINIIKNAVEAIEAVPQEERKAPGKVLVKSWHDRENIVIDVIDNGKGLPEEDRQKLLEPYMTTRQKGTGLGLAIVRKILEDHGGTIELMDAPEVAEGGRGAMMRMRIPRLNTTASETNSNTDFEGRSNVVEETDQTDNKIEAAS